MTAFTLKIIALVAMIFDHLAVTFSQYFPMEFRAIGRLSWPIFAYLLAEGFRHTKAPDKFIERLFMLALISQIPYSLAITWASQRDSISWTQAISFVSNTNIFYTLFLGGVAIMIYQWLQTKDKKIVAFVGAVFPTAVLAELLTADYGGMGVLFIFCMYIIAEKKHRLVAMGLFSLSQFLPVVLLLTHENFYYSNEMLVLHLMMIGFTLVSVGLVAKYNGERGLNIKWLFYAVYPVHLAVLSVVAIFI